MGIMIFQVISNCLIVDGSVAESSQNSIAGGIVINIQWSSTRTVQLNNSSIINNGDGTQAYDVYCLLLVQLQG